MHGNRNRKIYGYMIAKPECEIAQKLNDMNRTIGRIGFGIGLLGAGGYFLYKKVKDLSAEVKKLKETGK